MGLKTHFKKCASLMVPSLFGTILFTAASAQDVSEATAEIDENNNSRFDVNTIEEDYISVPLFKEREFTFTSGYDYSSGKFNLPTSTNISYIPYSLKYTEGPWSFRASSGYISFAGPKNLITAVEGAPLVTDVELSPADRGRTTRKSGFGDIYLSGTYALENPYSDDFFIDVTARVKLPTADENKGLGTGKFDYTIQTDVAYLIGNVMPFATLGYRFVGKTSLFDLQNSFFASVGLSYFLTRDTSFGVSYEYRESATPGFNSPKEIFSYIDVQLNDHWGLNVYSVVGLNNTTTDYGLGTQIRYKF